MPEKAKSAKQDKTDQPKQHLVYMWVLILMLAGLAIVGWSLYFLRSASYQAELQKAQSERNQALQHLQQYEDTKAEDLFNDYQ